MCAEFSVWVFMLDDSGEWHLPLERFVDAKTAMRAAHRAMLTPREETQRIIVTDGGDCTVFEWMRDTGEIWPRP